MQEPIIVHTYDHSVLLTLLLAGLTAWLFLRYGVPRQLNGLQVAFSTGQKRYEVHYVTESVSDVRELLSTKGMQFGVRMYILAITGALILLFEFLSNRIELTEGYNSISLSLALVLIAVPGLVSAGSSLGVQVIKPIGHSRASLQESTIWRTWLYSFITLAWIILSAVVYFVLDIFDITLSSRVSITILFAFSPSILAYGRVLGSSWAAMIQSNRAVAGGNRSLFHNFEPSAFQQAVAKIVQFNLAVMPIVAINSLVTLLIIAAQPDLLTHSDRVFSLPEYTPQSTVMEEGGLLGFLLIELFSYIPEANIRIPLVTFVLLFLLMNVALIGFLFVYEVAKILFLDVSDVSGRGGITLADSRLLRADRGQQARVLNFCFSGFAGQSMLLLALAMITFWDSQFLPQADACGSWENTICAIVEKNAMEELTWMLSAGGQIAFLSIWFRSLSVGARLDEIEFDSAAVSQREKLRNLQSRIYLKKTPIQELVEKGEWPQVIQRYEELARGTTAELSGLDLVKKTEASMFVFAGLSRWDEAEQEAVSLLALRGGEEAELAKMTLASASLAQRDVAEARPRIDFLPDNDIESARLRWFYSMLSGDKSKVLEMDESLLMVDPIMKRNLELIERVKQEEAWSKLNYDTVKTGRLLFAGDIGRARMLGQHENALTKLESYMQKDPDWLLGKVMKILLHLDAGRQATAARISDEFSKKDMRDPAVRSAILHLAKSDNTVQKPLSEPTGLIWLCDEIGDWGGGWQSRHNVAPAPNFKRKYLLEHGWNANCAIGYLAKEHFSKAVSKKEKGWKSLKGIQNAPPCLYTHLTGIIVTIGGMPVDLGLPPQLLN